ncbi:helix-turn-helix domain-containing protein [Methylobacterium sp. JK268]
MTNGKAVPRAGSVPALPPLAFGGRSAREDLDAEAMAERLSHERGATMDYRAPRRGDGFRSLSALVGINGQYLVANSCSAVGFRAAEPRRPHLLLPLAGRGVVRQDRREIAWSANESAALLAAFDSTGTLGRRSAVAIELAPAPMERLACRMLGREPGGEAVLDLEVLRALPLTAGPFAFGPLFRHLFGAVDACLATPALLDRSGLDDAIHRAVIMLLRPDLFAEQVTPPKAPRPKLADVCEYIRANLDQRLTLSVLEEVSGLSARVLQYAFREYHGCTPLQWIAAQRLDAVRAAILAAPPGTHLSAIASQYFSNLGEFSRKYRERFGELPSHTMATRREP